MKPDMVILHVNLDKGLFYKTFIFYKEDGKMVQRIFGKSCEIESVEMGCYKIGDRFYKTVGTYDIGMIQIEEITEEEE